MSNNFVKSQAILVPNERNGCNNHHSLKPSPKEPHTLSNHHYKREKTKIKEQNSLSSKNNCSDQSTRLKYLEGSQTVDGKERLSLCSNEGDCDNGMESILYSMIVTVSFTY